MPLRATKDEKRLLQSTECPACDALLSFGAVRCHKCGLNIARGALYGLRYPKHARAGMPRSWALRFLRSAEDSA